MHEHITNSAMLLTATSVKRELQRGIRHTKDSVAETKDGEERGCMDSSHVT
jgi:hypothetical protein